MGLGAGGQQPADPPAQSFSEPVPLTAELTKPPRDSLMTLSFMECRHLCGEPRLWTPREAIWKQLLIGVRLVEAEWNALVPDTSNLVSLWGRWGGGSPGAGWNSGLWFLERGGLGCGCREDYSGICIK